MALTRKYLKELGIESDKIDLIIDAHTEVTDALKTERDELKAGSEDTEKLKAEIVQLKQQTASDSEWKAKYEAKEAELTKYKGEQEALATMEAKKNAYIELLKEAKISDKAHAKALKLVDMDSLELEDGKLKGADKITESIKTEWADFVIDESVSGAKTNNPQGNDGVKAYTREDISKMTAEEINANWDSIKKSLKQ